MPDNFASDYQYFLMDLHWAFTGELFSDTSKFENAVREYQLDIANGAEAWNPHAVLIKDTHIVIYFDITNLEKTLQLGIELFSVNPGGFTELDIMLQLHNNLTPLLHQYKDSHIFFEGICTSQSWQKTGQATAYLLNLGS